MLLHDRIRPDAAQQLVFADDRAVGVDQRQQHIDRARTEFNGRTVHEQAALTPLQQKSTEP